MAANLVPASGVLDLHYNVSAVAVEEINTGDIPTDQQIVDETHRLLQIQKVQEKGGDANPGGVNVADYSSAIIRHHKVVSVRADNEIENTNAAILNKLNAMNEQINGRFDGIDAKINAISARMNAISARMNATSARFYNSCLHSVMTRTVAFSPVVKYIPGHPVDAGLPPAVPDVQFQPEYNINSPPPNGLMPLNNGELLGMRGSDLVVTRRRLRAIYWFYHDPSLALGAQANRATCDRVLDALDHFLKFP